MRPDKTRLLPIYAAVAALALASAFTIYWMGTRVVQANAAILQSHQIIEGLDSTLSTLKNAETSQRGFLLTGQEDYLKPYHAAVRRLDEQLRQLDQWAREGEVSPALSRAFTQSTQAELSELDQTIRLRREKGLDATLPVMRSNAEKRLMDELSSQIGQMEAEEQEEYAIIRKQRDQDSRLRTVVSAGMALTTLAFMTWAFGKIQQGISNTERAAEVAQEQKRLLAISEQRLDLALDSGGMGMWEWNLESGRSVWNARQYELLGLPTGNGAVETDDFFRLVHPDDLAQLRRVLSGVVAGNGELDTEFRVLRLDGQERWLAAIGRVVRDDQGRALRMIGVNYDITRRKQADEELRAAKRVVEQGSRAKDHFLATLSHELRTPLTPVLATVSLLQSESRLNPDLGESLEVIRRNVELEARLIDDLLDLTRIARGKVQLNTRVTDLGEVISRAVEICQPDIEARKLEFGIDIGPEAPYWIEADPARLQQVFWNLLKNAIKFTPPGGCVGIRCRRENGQVAAEINDSGEGIAPDALERIFNAFEQAEQSTARCFGGLGLGLAISKALVEMHGGTIEAHSQGKGKGATFRLRLPLVNSDECRVMSDESQAHSSLITHDLSLPRPLHILLVEDHGDTVKIIRRLLERRGHHVETAGDVVTAKQIVARQVIDLLISDLGLPDRSGLDLIRELRAVGHRFPAIALSGYGQAEDVTRSREAGFDVHVTKPDFEQLCRAIAAVPMESSHSR